MTIPLIIAIVAFLLAGFTFFKVSGLLHRISSLEKKNRELESGLKGLENNFKRNNPRNPQQQDSRPERGNQQRQPQQVQPARGKQPAPEQRQKQQPQQPAQERQPKQAQPPIQRQPQEARTRQEGQPQPHTQQQQRPPREPRQPQEGRQPRNPQQGQQPAQPQGGEAPRTQQQPQQRRSEPRRRDGMNPQDQNPQGNAPMQNPMLGNTMVGDDLLNELSQQQQPPQEPESPIRFAIIPEDGVIKTHQLQKRPDSDSYLEIDTPQEGSTQTRYRFNLAGNHAFVISLGMDRLEDAFTFKKPEDRTVTRIVQQGDGVLTRTGAGWKIQEKARIDFS